MGISKIPIRFFHIIYVWLFGWFYWTANYAAYAFNLNRDGALPFINWYDDTGAFGMSAADSVAFLVHVGLGCIHILCFLLSLLKFATADACCSYTVIQIDVNVPGGVGEPKNMKHTVTIPCELITSPTSRTKDDGAFFKPTVGHKSVLIPGNEFVN